MSIKGKYDACKEALIDDIETAIAKFEADTGCIVMSVGGDFHIHKAMGKVDCVSKFWGIETNINRDD